MMGFLLDSADRAVAPMIIRAEARREAEEIYNRMRDTIEAAMARIQKRRGQQMARLVMLYLMEMESNIPAAHLLSD